tara:strand:- start:2166 stop:2321 length:156 start_codon:yes stop_codon:yes gene_type:complete
MKRLAEFDEYKIEKDSLTKEHYELVARLHRGQKNIMWAIHCSLASMIKEGE